MTLRSCTLGFLLLLGAGGLAPAQAERREPREGRRFSVPVPCDVFSLTADGGKELLGRTPVEGGVAVGRPGAWYVSPEQDAKPSHLRVIAAELNRHEGGGIQLDHLFGVVNDEQVRALLELRTVWRLHLGTGLFGGCPASPETLAKLLARLIHLRSLEIHRAQLPSSIGKHLTAMPELRSLSLVNTNLSDEHLRRCLLPSRLESLDVSGTKITGRGLQAAFEFTAIVRLRAVRCELHSSAHESLLSSPALTYLDLSYASFERHLLMRLSNRDNLRSLGLSVGSGANQFESGLGVTLKLPRLRTLGLAGFVNTLPEIWGSPSTASGSDDDDVRSALRACPRLEKLELHACEITPELFSEDRWPKHVRSVRVSECPGLDRWLITDSKEVYPGLRVTRGSCSFGRGL